MIRGLAQPMDSGGTIALDPQAVEVGDGETDLRGAITTAGGSHQPADCCVEVFWNAGTTGVQQWTESRSPRRFGHSSTGRHSSRS